MLLSIGIPTYSRINYLVNMLESVSKQIEQHGLQDKVEIIVSNNCSVDDTEAVVLSLIAQGKDYIKYYRNDVNIGVVKNLMKTVKLASGKFWMFYGDDDLMCDNTLVDILKKLEDNIEHPVFVFKQKGYEGIKNDEQLTIYECAERYFYYMGNACSIVNAGLAKNSLKKYYTEITSTCWPQTHLMYLAMYSSQLRLPVIVSKIEVYEPQVKDGNNIYNAFYYYDSAFYALIRMGKLIADRNDKIFYGHIGKGIPFINPPKLKAFISSLMYLSKLSSINNEERDFKEVLKESLKAIKGKYWRIAFRIYINNLIPKEMYILFYVHSRCIYYLLKRNGRSYRENYRFVMNTIKQSKQEKLDRLKKKHAININKGEW